MSVPALSAPVTVWSDDHLAAVVCICVVHIQLQLLPLIRFNDGEEVLALWTDQNQPTANLQSELLLGRKACTSFIKVSAPMM